MSWEQSYSCTCSPWTRSSMSGLEDWQRIPAMDMTWTWLEEQRAIVVPVVPGPDPPCLGWRTGRGSPPWTWPWLGEQRAIVVPVVPGPGPPCLDCWTGRGSQPWTWPCLGVQRAIVVPVVPGPGPPCLGYWTGRGSQPWTWPCQENRTHTGSHGRSTAAPKQASISRAGPSDVIMCNISLTYR